MIDTPERPASFLSTLSKELALIEKRDWELWMLVVVAGFFVSAGLLLILLPSVPASNGNLHFEITISRQLFFGLAALLVLFNLYVISRRLEFRKTRQQLISTTVQSELIRLQSFTDPLTEVYNRRSLDEIAGRYISHARRRGTTLSFLLVDVDRFKEVNTRFGHLTGDVVLAEIASVLKVSVRGSDCVVRYGGDEFLVMLADANFESAKVVVSRMHSAIENWNAAGQLENFSLTLSIGLAEWKDGQTLDETLDEADRNMYSVKAKSRSASKKFPAAEA